MTVMEAARRRATGGHSNGHHWAAKCKTDFAKEFGEKGIPLEHVADNTGQEEKELEDFFRMKDGALNNKLENAVAFASIAFSSSINSTPCEEPVAYWKVRNKLWAKVLMRRMSRSSQPEPEDGEAQLGSSVQGSSSTGSTDLGLPAVLPPALDEADSGSATPSAFGDNELSISKSAPVSSTWFRKLRGRTGPLDSPQSSASPMSGSTPLTFFQSEDYSLNQIDDLEPRLPQSARDRVHRPVSPRELVHAHPPTPLHHSDFPPLTRRVGGRQLEKPKESHYCYFSRCLADDRPLRRVMEQRACGEKRIITSLDGDTHHQEALESGSVGGSSCSPSSPASPVLPAMSLTPMPPSTKREVKPKRNFHTAPASFHSDDPHAGQPSVESESAVDNEDGSKQPVASLLSSSGHASSHPVRPLRRLPPAVDEGRKRPSRPTRYSAQSVDGKRTSKGQ